MEQRDPDKYASDHCQVVLKPLLKLGDAAFHVDVRPLLRVLGEPTSSRSDVDPLNAVKPCFHTDLTPPSQQFPLNYATVERPEPMLREGG